jgi:hypothetical protein
MDTITYLLPSKRNDVRTGEAAERLVLAKLLRWGYDAHDAGRYFPYDIVVDTGNGLCRVQVKARTRSKGGHWDFRVTRGNWRSATGTYDYAVSDYDVSAFVALDIEKVLFVPGVMTRFRAKTQAFMHQGAEQMSWNQALRPFTPRN